MRRRTEVNATSRAPFVAGLFALALKVSVPMQERLFGQGARAKFGNVVVTTDD
jgi:hypothetical protein